MIRHDYGACATCHTDPSGAGVLTAYGRAQSAILLSTPNGAEEEAGPGPIADFLFGAVALPDWLLLQGWFRNAYLWNYSNDTLADSRLLQMVADLGGYVTLGAFRAGGTIGYNVAGAAVDGEGAWLTPQSDSGNLVSRTHWLGVSLAEDAVLVRAGRINVPFGLRNIEHTSWVRSETRTDIDQHQEHGVAAAYTGERLRGEAMAILGNYQVNPDAYRERGYSMFAEMLFGSHYALGVSSLATHAAADVQTQKDTTRQAHGAFVRAAPWKQLALLGEFDALVTSAAGDPTQAGYVAFAQADVEPIQSVHGMVSGEILNRGGPGEVLNTGVWLGAAWFALPHVDMRIDAIRRFASGSPATSTTVLLQFHVYL